MFEAKHLAAAALSALSLLACGAALAAGSASSTASAGSSASVGSISGSIDTSSNSSSRGGNVAAGPYQVIEVAAVADRPGVLRVRLQALAGGAEWALTLPQATAEQARLVAGDTVDVRTRDYGLQFARADTQQAFFLVLHDTAWRELQSRPVTL